METTQNNEAVAEWVNALAPGLRARARDYLRQLLAVPVDSVALTESAAVIQRRLRHDTIALPSADAPIPLPVVAFVGIFTAAVSLRFGLLAFLAVLLIPLAVGFWSYAQGANRALANDNARAALLDASVSDALPCVAQTRHERAYTAAVLGLLSVTGGYLSPEMRREQMAQLAALLESGERLDAVRAEIASALSSESPESLRAEADALRARATRAADPATRAALAQSITLLSERLRRAESLSGLTERMDAESELVYQAFRSAQGSVAALRVSPTVAGLDAGASTGSVLDVADSIRRQTQAVEAAVQELGIQR